MLKLVIWNCLEKADELKCSSIAFPSLGTGKLLHPFSLVAETMYHTIHCYERCHSDTKIKDISIVLYEKDTECIKVRSLFDYHGVCQSLLIFHFIAMNFSFYVTWVTSIARSLTVVICYQFYIFKLVKSYHFKQFEASLI